MWPSLEAATEGDLSILCQFYKCCFCFCLLHLIFNLVLLVRGWYNFWKMLAWNALLDLKIVWYFCLRCAETLWIILSLLNFDTSAVILLKTLCLCNLILLWIAVSTNLFVVEWHKLICFWMSKTWMYKIHGFNLCFRMF